MGVNIHISVGKDENIEKAIKRFKRLCEKAGIKKEAKARQHYEKPSETRRKKIRALERAKRNNKQKAKASRYSRKASSAPSSVVHPKIARLTNNKDGKK